MSVQPLSELLSETEADLQRLRHRLDTLVLQSQLDEDLSTNSEHDALIESLRELIARTERSLSARSSAALVIESTNIHLPVIQKQTVAPTFSLLPDNLAITGIDTQLRRLPARHTQLPRLTHKQRMHDEKLADILDNPTHAQHRALVQSMIDNPSQSPSSFRSPAALAMASAEFQVKTTAARIYPHTTLQVERQRVIAAAALPLPRIQPRAASASRALVSSPPATSRSAEHRIIATQSLPGPLHQRLIHRAIDLPFDNSKSLISLASSAASPSASATALLPAPISLSQLTAEPPSFGSRSYDSLLDEYSLHLLLFHRSRFVEVCSKFFRFGLTHTFSHSHSLTRSHSSLILPPEHT